MKAFIAALALSCTAMPAGAADFIIDGTHTKDVKFNGFDFEIPDVYIDLGHREDSHVSWCYRHKPNYDEDSDMYYSHGDWRPCIAPFD